MTNKVSKTKSSIKGFAWMFFGNTFNNISQLIIIGILARLLTPEEFGIIGIILLFVNFSNIFTQLGIGTALVQKKEITQAHISLGFSLSVLLGTLVGLLFYWIAPFIGQFFNLENLEAPIRFFAFFFPLKGLNSVSTALLQRDLKFPAIVKSNALSYFFGYGITAVTLAFMGYGLWSLIYGQLAILIVQTIILLYYITPRFSILNSKQTYNDLLFFGSGFTLDLTFNFFAENSDNIIVGKLLGTTALGIYSRAFQFLSLPASFFGQIYNKVLFPILSSKQDDKEKLTSFYVFSISFCLLILFPVSLILLFNAELLVKVLLGNQWLEVIAPFQILILGFCFRFGTRINKSFLASLGLVYHGALYQFIFAVVMITTCLIAVHYYGIIGVTFAVLFTTIVNYVQVSYRIQKLLNFNYSYFLKLHLKALITFIPIIVIIILTLVYYKELSWPYIFAITLVVILPLLLIPLRSKYSIFQDQHNVTMFKQLIDNSPSFVKRISTKLKLVK